MMETTTTQRALTDEELAAIVQMIATAPTMDEAVQRAAYGTYNALLAPAGKSVADYSPEQPLNTADFAIPDDQSRVIEDAIMARAADLSADLFTALCALDAWCTYGPNLLTGHAQR
jgi:hypothetical protein